MYAQSFPRIASPVTRGWLLFALLAICGLLAADAGAATTEPAALSFTISEIRSDTGPLMIQIMNSKASYAREAPAIASLILPARIGSITTMLDALPVGDYVIRVMHDLDGDGELKTNLVGMPQEPWGLSNNATGRFGPPKWEDAMFALPQVAPQNIRLNH